MKEFILIVFLSFFAVGAFIDAMHGGKVTGFIVTLLKKFTSKIVSK